MIDSNLFLRIEALELTVRSYNCLKGAKINFLGDLINCGKRKLKKIPHFGKKCLKEVSDTLKRYGYSFDSTINEWPPIFFRTQLPNFSTNIHPFRRCKSPPLENLPSYIIDKISKIDLVPTPACNFVNDMCNKLLDFICDYFPDNKQQAAIDEISKLVGGKAWDDTQMESFSKKPYPHTIKISEETGFFIGMRLSQIIDEYPYSVRDNPIEVRTIVEEEMQRLVFTARDNVGLDLRSPHHIN